MTLLLFAQIHNQVVPPKARRMVELILESFKLMTHSHTNVENCKTLVATAVELQDLALVNESLLNHPTFTIQLVEAFMEVKEFISLFSSR